MAAFSMFLPPAQKEWGFTVICFQLFLSSFFAVVVVVVVVSGFLESSISVSIFGSCGWPGNRRGCVSMSWLLVFRFYGAEHACLRLRKDFPEHACFHLPFILFLLSPSPHLSPPRPLSPSPLFFDTLTVCCFKEGVFPMYDYCLTSCSQ